MRTRTKILASLGSCLLMSASLGCSSSTQDDANSVTVGLLLPFTGADSATSSNFERAALYAAKRVNQGGGIGGKQLRIVSRDTHSELEAGKRSAQWLIDAGAKVVIGPESAEIAPELYPILTTNGVALLSPLVGAGEEPEEPTFDCNTPWFRLAPSAKSMGENLSNEIVREHVTEVAIIYANDAYNQALSAALRTLFVSRGGTVPLELRVDAGAQSYADTVQKVQAQGVGSVVLAMSARAGALLVNEFDAVSSRHPRWFLSPLLKTELLVANVAPDALEGAVGVAPQIFAKGDEFPNAFAREWQGDQPLEGAYFYYDAVALLAFALQKAVVNGATGLPELATMLQDVSAPPGEGFDWDAVEQGLSRLRSGDDIFYSGLTGRILLEGNSCAHTGDCFATCGGRQVGRGDPFSVENGQIVDHAPTSL